MFRLDYLSCALTILSTVLVSRRLWQGWLVAGANSLIICWIGIRTAQLGFVPANLFCLALYAHAIYRWRASSQTNQKTVAGDQGFSTPVNKTAFAGDPGAAVRQPSSPQTASYKGSPHELRLVGSTGQCAGIAPEAQPIAHDQPGRDRDRIPPHRLPARRRLQRRRAR